jgi:hypothetical protein
LELTIRYKGLLPAAGAEKRIREKHAIRQELSGQLAAYWEQSRRLKKLFEHPKELQIAKRARDQFVVERPLADGTKFWWRWPLSGYNYIALVTQVLEAHVELKMASLSKESRNSF